jgi:hypothetical protein
MGFSQPKTGPRWQQRRKFGCIIKTEFAVQRRKKIYSCFGDPFLICDYSGVEVLESLVGCDLGNICAKAEKAVNEN